MRTTYVKRSRKYKQPALLKGDVWVQGVRCRQYVWNNCIRMMLRSLCMRASPLPRVKMQFGKYKGLSCDDVPDGYVRWMMSTWDARWDRYPGLKQALTNRLASMEPTPPKLLRALPRPRVEMQFGKYKGMSFDDVPNEYIIHE